MCYKYFAELELPKRDVFWLLNFTPIYTRMGIRFSIARILQVRYDTVFKRRHFIPDQV